MKTEIAYRRQLERHLVGGEAFVPLQEFLEKVPYEQLGERPFGLPYSFYETFYHIAFTQRDILDFIRKDSYREPEWPQDYWPVDKGPDSPDQWNQVKERYFRDRETLRQLLHDPATELMLPVRKGDDHSLFREIMLVVEHTAYHTGQLMIIVRLLGLHSS